MESVLSPLTVALPPFPTWVNGSTFLPVVHVLNIREIPTLLSLIPPANPVIFSFRHILHTNNLTTFSTNLFQGPIRFPGTGLSYHFSSFILSSSLKTDYNQLFKNMPHMSFFCSESSNNFSSCSVITVTSRTLSGRLLVDSLSLCLVLLFTLLLCSTALLSWLLISLVKTHSQTSVFFVWESNGHICHVSLCLIKIGFWQLFTGRVSWLFRTNKQTHIFLIILYHLCVNSHCIKVKIQI